jgi:hypothetical protein
MTDGPTEKLKAAQAEFARASRELHRQEVAALLRARPGLSYASVGEDRTGPFLVAYEGQILGEAWTTSPGVFHDWYSRRTGPEASPDTYQHGPHCSARAAAAALIPCLQANGSDRVSVNGE